MASSAGEIMLNYVAPDRRFLGISTAILAALEQSLINEGQTEFHLMSTQTARGFYAGRGYSDAGPPVLDDGMISYPMEKSIRSDGQA